MSIGRMPYDNWFLEQAITVAKRSTCLRRAVGCVLINHRRHVLSTGYNGVASGMPHCNEVVWVGQTGEYPHKCPGADLPSTKGLDMCEAIHAEQNALLQCRDVYDIDTAYVTASPCIHCVKLLLNTSCRRIVYRDLYDECALGLWKRAERLADHVGI